MLEIFKVLWPYLAGLFFIDCIAFVDQHQRLFVSLWGRRPHLKKCGLRIFGLLPTGISFLTSNLPFVLTSKGLYFPKALHLPEKVVYRENDFQFIAFDAVEKIRSEGKEVYINGAPAMKTTSSGGAKSIENILKELARLTADRRWKKIDSWLQKKIIDADISDRFTVCQRNFALLNVLCGLLFALLFVVLPLSIYTNVYLYVPLGALVTGIAGIYMIVVVLTYITHRKIYPDEPLERAYVMFSITLSPVAAAHVVHYLTKPLFAADHFTAVAAEFMPMDHFREDIRKEILTATYSKSGYNDPEWTLFWTRKASLLRRLAAGKGLTVSELTAPSSRRDESAVCYCPFCRAEYRRCHDKCHDCGVGLLEYEQTITTR